VWLTRALQLKVLVLQAVTPKSDIDDEYPWRRALLWMLALGSLFLIGYPAINRYAEVHSVLIAPRFAWEAAIPFLAWTVVPYLLLNLIFPLSFFVCERRRELDVHALRLLGAQLASFTAFLMWPMRRAQLPPVDESWATGLFEALLAFDRPFNMMPSLHLAVLVIVWDLLRRKSMQHWHPRWHRGWRWLCHLGAAAIAVSTLTTWQHHVLDVSAGVLLGALCVLCIRWPPTANV
jgi:membrane-associated phospholipid phosphatase